MSYGFSKYTASSEELLYHLQQQVASEEWHEYIENTNDMRRFAKERAGDPVQDKITQSIGDIFETIETGQTPSPLESRLDNFILRSYEAKLHETISNLGIPLNEKVVVGTLPLPILNAAHIVVPSGDGRLILINFGLRIILLLMAKVVASFIPIMNEKDGILEFGLTQQHKQHIELNLRNNAKAHSRYVELMTSLILNRFENSFHFGSPYLLEGPESVMAHSLLQVAEVFTLAHEYSHALTEKEKLIFDKHVEKMKFFDVEVDVVTKSLVMETVADTVGYHLTLVTMGRQGFSLDFIHMGIEFLLSCLAITEMLNYLPIENVNWDKIRAVINVSDANTHPPVSVRRQIARLNLKKYSKRPDYSVQFGETMEWLMWELWESDINLAKQLYLQVKPWPPPIRTETIARVCSMMRGETLTKYPS